MDILNEIAGRTTRRVEVKKKELPLHTIKRRALETAIEPGFPFERALTTVDISFICEIKKASPSKGVIAWDIDHVQIAVEYAEAGAAAVSVLTEPYYFGGSDDFLNEVAGAVRIPLLRKDFTIDEYMIYEARALGASAVLLICSLLRREALAEFIEVAHGLGLTALVEAHDERELETALRSGARVIGVNNRDLKTFEVDTANSLRLKKMTPNNVLFVSESGIKTTGDVELLRQAGVDAVLIGESLMRAPDKKAALAALRGYPI